MLRWMQWHTMPSMCTINEAHVRQGQSTSTHLIIHFIRCNKSSFLQVMFIQSCAFCVGLIIDNRRCGRGLSIKPSSSLLLFPIVFSLVLSFSNLEYEFFENTTDIIVRPVSMQACLNSSTKDPLLGHQNQATPSALRGYGLHVVCTSWCAI